MTRHPIPSAYDASSEAVASEPAPDGALRVHYVTMAFPAPSETFATNDVRTLASMGVDVTVHALREAHPDARELARERGVANVPVMHTDVRTLASGTASFFARPRVAATLLAGVVRHSASRPAHLVKSLLLAPRVMDVYRRIERSRPDVVHLYWGHFPAIVGHLVQHHLPDVVVSISLAAYDLEMRFGLSGPVARRADMVRTLGRVNVPDLRDAFGVPEKDVTVIPDGVDMRAFERLGARPAKVPNRIVTAGRLIPSKGISDVLEVFARVARRVPDATLVVLGDGPERAKLEQKARDLSIGDAVTFRGHVRHEDVFAEMARAEIFVFMSAKTSERLPNVVKEAMGCRCLCIATDTPGIHELLTHGTSGWIVPRHGIDETVRHLLHTLEDRSDRLIETMTTHAFEHLRQSFALDTSVDAYVRAWSDLVREKRRS